MFSKYQFFYNFELYIIKDIKDSYVHWQTCKVSTVELKKQRNYVSVISNEMTLDPYLK